MFKRAGIAIMTLLTSGIGIAGEVRIDQRWASPMAEISGLAIHDSILYLASDHETNILKIPLAGSQSLSLDKQTSLQLTPSKQLDKTSQWEAIASDGDGQIFTVKETTDTIFQIAPDGNVLKTFTLERGGGKRNKSKGFEGLALLKSSHFLLALSKPPRLVEYGPDGDKALGVSLQTLLGATEAFKAPAGDSLKVLAQWTLKRPSRCQFSDLAVDSDKAIFALLKDCNRIVRLPDIDPSKSEFERAESWDMPNELVHAEGLVSLGKDGFLVALDMHALEKNLFLLKK